MDLRVNQGNERTCRMLKKGFSNLTTLLQALNAIGAFGATIGKTNIVVHRYLVMRSRDFAETVGNSIRWFVMNPVQNWPRKSITRLLAVQFVFCVLLTASIWPASYIYANKEAMDRIVALSKFETMVRRSHAPNTFNKCAQIQMAIAVATYILYIISNGIFTVLTSRELIRMKGMLEVCDSLWSRVPLENIIEQRCCIKKNYGSSTQHGHNCYNLFFDSSNEDGTSGWL